MLIASGSSPSGADVEEPMGYRSRATVNPGLRRRAMSRVDAAGIISRFAAFECGRTFQVRHCPGKGNRMARTLHIAAVALLFVGVATTPAAAQQGQRRA